MRRSNEDRRGCGCGGFQTPDGEPDEIARTSQARGRQRVGQPACTAVTRMAASAHAPPRRRAGARGEPRVGPSRSATISSRRISRSGSRGLVAVEERPRKRLADCDQLEQRSSIGRELADPVADQLQEPASGTDVAAPAPEPVVFDEPLPLEPVEHQLANK